MNYIKRLKEKYQDVFVDFMDLLPPTKQDFAWKVRRRMRFDRNPVFVIVQDKYRVKRYAEERGVRTAETFYVTDKPETIPFDSLPGNYFLKVNHGYNWNIVFNNGDFFLHKTDLSILRIDGFLENKITREEAIKYCKLWLNTRFSMKEWAYSQICPLAFVEEVLEPFDSDELVDYKFYAFNGVAKAVNVLSPVIRRQNENIFLDTNWNLFDLPDDKYNHPVAPPKKPDNFNEMLSVVRCVGRELDFARIDLYNTTRGIILGEITLYPEGGRLNSPSFDKNFNKWLGDQWILPPGIG